MKNSQRYHHRRRQKTNQHIHAALECEVSLINTEKILEINQQ